METELEEQFVDEAMQDKTPVEKTESTVDDGKAREDRLTAALEQLAKGQQKPEVKEEKKQMSKEEEAELWAIYNPTKANPKFFHQMFGLGDDVEPQTLAQRQAAFDEMQKGLVRQAVVGARNLFQQELAKLREEYEPVRNDYTSRQQEKIVEGFYKKYPTLAIEDESGNKRFAGLLRAAHESLSTKTFASQDAYYSALAESAAATIKGVLPEFALDKPQKQTPTRPGIPRTRVGGTGGTGNGSASLAKTGNDDDASTLDFMK